MYPAAAFIAVIAFAMPASALASRAFGSRLLQQGMTGGDVSTLQKWLTVAGFRTPVVGVFGPITAGNVRRFERRYRLTVNGVVSARVARKLGIVVAEKIQAQTAGGGGGAQVSTAPPPTVAPTPTTPTTPTPAAPTVPVTGLFGPRALKLGMHGRWVRQMQQYLSAAGFAIADDSTFGSATQTTVTAFEQSKGLKPDGIMSLAVANALRATVAAIDANNTTGKAVLSPEGLAVAPVGAPTAVKAVIAAANAIATMPYIYGGGHASWVDTGYDCSGSTSFALHAAGLISAPEDSGEMESYGQRGRGAWITLYANAGHVYMKIAGLWFDTAAQSSTNGNSRWSTTRISPRWGFVVRHPVGL